MLSLRGFIALWCSYFCFGVWCLVGFVVAELVLVLFISVGWLLLSFACGCGLVLIWLGGLLLGLVFGL